MRHALALRVKYAATSTIRSVPVGYRAAAGAAALVTAVFAPFSERIGPTAAFLAFLLAVLLVATRWGSLPGLVTALLAAVAFDLVFLHPTYALKLDDARNWAALGGLVVAAIAAEKMSDRGRRAPDAPGQPPGPMASTATHRSLLEAYLDPLVTINAQGEITDANDAAAMVRGVSKETLVGTDFASHFTEPDKAREAYRRAFTEGFVTDFPLTIRDRRDGRLTEVLYNASVYKNADGTIGGVVAAARQVAEPSKAENDLRRINQAHRALSRCNHSLVRATDQEAWLSEVCRIVVEEAGYAFCWVGRAERGERRNVRPIAQAGRDDGYLKHTTVTWANEPNGRGPAGTAIREGRSVVARDVATDPTFEPWREAAMQRGFASCIGIPLTLDGAPGALTIYSAEPNAFGDEEMSLLGELAQDLTYGISVMLTRAERDKAQKQLAEANSQLEQRVAARTAELRAALDRETETAARIQQTLLLDELPREVRGLRVAALTNPSQRIAGDFYGFFLHEESDCLDVIVADVMGKGVPAALLGAATKSYFPMALWHLLATSPEGVLPDPKDIVTLAHARLARHLVEVESFVTACYARFDVVQRSLELVDCGHTGVVTFRPKTGDCAILHGDNLPLGVREGEIYRQTRVPLEVDDVVVFFSDGVTEARDAERELFGTERLAECVKRSGGGDPGSLVAAIRDAVTTFTAARPLRDDLTCVVVQMVAHELPVARGDLEIRSALPELRRGRQFVESFCTERLNPPLGAEAVASLVLAVNEAASNIMRHAYRDRDDQRIDIAAEAFDDRVSFRLRYMGLPFDPSAVPQPSFDGSRESGFGVFVISKSVDAVRYYRDDLNRNCIRLEKKRAPASARR